jgi:site-specific DNA-methyltransferase (adenine-specific)
MDNKIIIDHIYQADCIQLMQKWPDHSFDHCVTDPPYNISKKNGLAWAFSSHITMSEEWDLFTKDEYLAFSRLWIKEVTRLVKPNGNIFIFGSYHNIYDIGHILNELDLKIVNSITWYKPNAQPNITCRMLTESTEYIIWACNSTKNKAHNWTFHYDTAKKFNAGKQLRNMWSIPYTPKKEKVFGYHPSQKPVDLIARILLIATDPGDNILDCFAGSGSIGVVASNLNRHWVMIENKKEYVQIAKDRIKKEKISKPFIE